MYTFQIKTYREGTTLPEFHFFILSKGENAGKPLEAPCPNCFVVKVDSTQSRDHFFWLAYALWQGSKFKPYLIGSVILFLRIGEVKKLLQLASNVVLARPKELEITIKLMNQISQQRANIQQHCLELERTQRALLKKLFR